MANKLIRDPDQPRHLSEYGDAGLHPVPSKLWAGYPWADFLRRAVLPHGNPKYRERSADGRQVGPVYSDPTIATLDIDIWLERNPGSNKLPADTAGQERGLIGTLYEAIQLKPGAFGFAIDLKPIFERLRCYFIMIRRDFIINMIRRWQAVRQLWWLWLAMGLSGGFASALWLLPGHPIAAPPQKSGTPTATESTVANQLVERPFPTHLDYFQGLRLLEFLRMRPMGLRGGPAAPSPQDSKWALLITSSPENQWLSGLLSSLIVNAGIPVHTLQAPDRSFNLDAPALPEERESGVIIHGENLLNDRITNIFGMCFIIRKTNKPFDDVRDWYKSQIMNDEQFVWIEIGKGSPWRYGSSCAF